MPRLLVVTLLFAISPLPANAQQPWVGAALGAEHHNFPEDDVPNRLDGVALAWSASGGVVLGSHFVVAGEWSRSKPIDDEQTLSLDVNGRVIAITSTYRHHVQSISVLGGYSHRVGQRVRLFYLAGVSLTHVRREFSSNAASRVLVAPSRGSAEPATRLDDRFPALTGGVDAIVLVTPRLGVVGGLRFQKLGLEPDQAGLSVRTTGGMRWLF